MFQNEASLELKFDGAADKSCCDSVRGYENSGSSFCKDAETSFIEQIFRHRWNLHELYQKMANIRKQEGFPGQLVQNDDWKIKLIFQVFPPSAEQFSLYLSELVEEGAPFTVFKTIKSAFPFYYAARNEQSLPVTQLPFVKLLLEGASRDAAKKRGPTKKASTLNEDETKSILRSSFWPEGSIAFPNTSFKDWRTGVKLFTFYATFCRWDCYMKLSPASFTFNEDHVMIVYESAKNDLYYTGSTSVIAYDQGSLLCPYLIYKTYFQIMGFEGLSSEKLNCRLRPTGQPNRKLPLSYGASLKDTKELLARHGHEDGFSEKSLKSTGVTILLDKGTSLPDVQIFGRWKSEQTPLFYHNSSISRRMQVSRKLI